MTSFALLLGVFLGVPLGAFFAVTLHDDEMVVRLGRHTLTINNHHTRSH